MSLFFTPGAHWAKFFPRAIKWSYPDCHQYIHRQATWKNQEQGHDDTFRQHCMHPTFENFSNSFSLDISLWILFFTILHCWKLEAWSWKPPLTFFFLMFFFKKRGRDFLHTGTLLPILNHGSDAIFLRSCLSAHLCSDGPYAGQVGDYREPQMYGWDARSYLAGSHFPWVSLLLLVLLCWPSKARMEISSNVWPSPTAVTTLLFINCGRSPCLCTTLLHWLCWAVKSNLGHLSEEVPDISVGMGCMRCAS